MPASIIELRIEKHRFAIEVGDEHRTDLAFIDYVQDLHHRSRRIEPAQIDMYCVRRTPYTRALNCPGAGHDPSLEHAVGVIGRS